MKLTSIVGALAAAALVAASAPALVTAAEGQESYADGLRREGKRRR